jgi:biotin transport system substrate-specific component
VAGYMEVLILKVKYWLLSGLFAALTVVGAFVRVPLPMVPFTMQVMIVLMSGLVLGPKYGPLSQVIYLLLGLAGLPVFSGGGGLGYVFSPTFGYLLSYPFASWMSGRLRPSGAASPLGFVLASAGGLAVIYILGVSVLMVNLNLVAGKQVDLAQAVKIGVLPFILPDTLKVAGAALLAAKVAPVSAEDRG